MIILNAPEILPKTKEISQSFVVFANTTTDPVLFLRRHKKHEIKFGVQSMAIMIIAMLIHMVLMVSDFSYSFLLFFHNGWYESSSILWKTKPNQNVCLQVSTYFPGFVYRILRNTLQIGSFAFFCNHVNRYEKMWMIVTKLEWRVQESTAYHFRLGTYIFNRFDCAV